MQPTAEATEHLSTFGGSNLRPMLKSFGVGPVILCQSAIWTRQTMTGQLEEKGAWVHRYWDTVRQAIPESEGFRDGWNRVFLALPSKNITESVQRFSGVLQLCYEPNLMSFCVLCEVAGEPMHKIDVVDVLGHEISSLQDFGASREYQPNGYRFYHLLDGKPYSAK